MAKTRSRAGKNRPSSRTQSSRSRPAKSKARPRAPSRKGRQPVARRERPAMPAAPRKAGLGESVGGLLGGLGETLGGVTKGLGQTLGSVVDSALGVLQPLLAPLQQLQQSALAGNPKAVEGYDKAVDILRQSASGGKDEAAELLRQLGETLEEEE